MSEQLTFLEIKVLELWTSSTHLGFHAIGLKLGISDAEARRHFDNALDKLKRKRPPSDAQTILTTQTEPTEDAQ